MHTYSSKVECKYNHYSNFISSTILDYSKKIYIQIKIVLSLIHKDSAGRQF